MLFSQPRWDRSLQWDMCEWCRGRSIISSDNVPIRFKLHTSTGMPLARSPARRRLLDTLVVQKVI
jgi:hypothetical protein